MYIIRKVECYNFSVRCIKGKKGKGLLDYKNKQVLVTGGAGFIGSELVHQLAEMEADIIVVDNLVNGKAINLADLPAERVRLEICNIRDRARMAELLPGVEVVFHLAALGVRHSIHSSEENHDVNATGTLDLLVESRAAHVKRFVCVSTSEVYGTGYKVPMDEEHTTFPMTVYGAAKLAGESYARAFYKTYGYPTVVIRPFNTFGPRSHHEGDCGEVLPKFMLRAMTDNPLIIFGDGKQTRDFTYVSDTAHGILLAGFADQVIGETINIGSGKEISINALAEKVKEILGKKGVKIEHDAPRPGDNLRLYADITKARELLGFEPQVKLEEALLLLNKWYSQQE